MFDLTLNMHPHFGTLTANFLLICWSQYKDLPIYRAILKQWDFHYDMILTELRTVGLSLWYDTHWTWPYFTDSKMQDQQIGLPVHNKVINGDVFFLPECFNQTSSNCGLHSHPTLCHQHCRNNYLLNSFVPHHFGTIYPNHINTAPTILVLKHLLYNISWPF